MFQVPQSETIGTQSGIFPDPVWILASQFRAEAVNISDRVQKYFGPSPEFCAARNWDSDRIQTGPKRVKIESGKISD